MFPLAVIAAVVVSVIIIAGIIYIAMTIKCRINERSARAAIKNNERIQNAAKALCRERSGNTVKLDLLDENGCRFSELTLTGSSAAKRIKPGKEIIIK